MGYENVASGAGHWTKVLRRLVTAHRWDTSISSVIAIWSQVGRLRGGEDEESSVDLDATSSEVSSDDSDSCSVDDGECDGDVGGSGAGSGQGKAMDSIAKDLANMNARGPRKQPPPRKQRPPESSSESESEEDESDLAKKEAAAAAITAAKEARLQRKEEADRLKSKEKLRSPILCILGHVDTGKTKLLDKIRCTNVQENEAGGITQQIGATFFPIDALRKGWQMEGVAKDALEAKIPGLLVIDTPGHESFSNLRSRGASLCDICILVVDLVHGLEPQTIESLELLKQKRCPFFVALNKIDRCYGWVPCPNAPIEEALKQQPQHTVEEFYQRWESVRGEIAAQGLNAELFYRNKNVRKVVSVVPTSALSGEGIADLLGLAVDLTQRMLEKRLMLGAALQATVLEVKVMEGLGTTLDVILLHGELREGDTIVACGMAGPIVSSVRSLLTPHPMREMRVKNEFVQHKAISAAIGVKIAAPGLDGAVAGTPLLRLEKEDSLDELKATVMEDLREIMGDISTVGKGVHVQASTLGALEALLDFLRNSSIPVASVNIGPLYKRDVIRAGTMVDKNPDYAVVLAFDVKVVPEASELAKQIGVTVFTANIIYHLFDKFTAHMEARKAHKRSALASKGVAIFPVRRFGV
jgi:translation initiation factor 5B